jgi:bacterioferritin
MYQESIVLLNKAIGGELSAVHQYMYFHFQCDDQGYDLLAALFKQTAIQEMLHIEKVAERVLFLKGEIEMVATEPVHKTRDVKKMLEISQQSEEQSIKDYNNWAVACASHADSMSKKLFEELVMDEERHYNQFDTELENISKFGNEYLALQSIERSKTVSLTPANPNSKKV